MIDRPTSLVFTLEVPRHFPGVTRVRVDITPMAGGSELSFVQAGVDPEATRGAWLAMFGQLAEALRGSG